MTKLNRDSFEWTSQDGTVRKMDQIEDTHLLYIERYLRGGGNVQLQSAMPGKHRVVLEEIANRGLVLLAGVENQQPATATGFAFHMSRKINRESILAKGILIPSERLKSTYKLASYNDVVWLSTNPFYWQSGSAANDYDTFKCRIDGLKIYYKSGGLYQMAESVPPEKVELWVPQEARVFAKSWDKKIEVKVEILYPPSKFDTDYEELYPDLPVYLRGL